MRHNSSSQLKFVFSAVSLLVAASLNIIPMESSLAAEQEPRNKQQNEQSSQPLTPERIREAAKNGTNTNTAPEPTNSPNPGSSIEPESTSSPPNNTNPANTTGSGTENNGGTRKPQTGTRNNGGRRKPQTGIRRNRGTRTQQTGTRRNRTDRQQTETRRNRINRQQTETTTVEKQPRTRTQRFTRFQEGKTRRIIRRQRPVTQPLQNNFPRARG